MKLSKPWVAGIAVGLLALSLVASSSQAGMQGMARWSLVGVGLLGAVLWGARVKAAKGAGAAPEALKLTGRLGLSPSVSLSLVEVEGRSFLIAHGNGFAQFRELDGEEVAS